MSFFDSLYPKVASHFPARSQESCEFAAPFWMWSAGWATLAAHRFKPLASLLLRPVAGRRERERGPWRTSSWALLQNATDPQSPTTLCPRRNKKLCPAKPLALSSEEGSLDLCCLSFQTVFDSFAFPALELVSHDRFDSTWGVLISLTNRRRLKIWQQDEFSILFNFERHYQSKIWTHAMGWMSFLSFSWLLTLYFLI